MGPNAITGVIPQGKVRRRDRDRHTGRTRCGDRNRLEDMSTKQETLRIAGNHWELGRSESLQREHDSANTLISDF